MALRRPRLPVLVTLISLVTVGFFVYTSPNLDVWSFHGFNGGWSSEAGSLDSNGQMVDGIQSVNSVPTGLPARQAFTIEQMGSRTKAVSGNEDQIKQINEPAIIIEDSTKESNKYSKPLKEQKKLDHSLRVQSSDEIPNIFHFTHLQTSTATLDIGFQQFISIYSAYHYCKPSKIYIHTNVNGEAFRRARRSRNQWTRKIASMPMVEFNHELAPNASHGGVQITKLAHQSDFIRTRVMKKWGGIFMDEDSYLLKDLAPLRRAGYKNIVARQVDGKVGCGMFLSAPGSQLVKAYQELQDQVFDGRWTTHSVDLFTRLIDDFSELEKEVLVMDHTAFFPLSW
jgi:hypothetical protein